MIWWVTADTLEPLHGGQSVSARARQDSLDFQASPAVLETFPPLPFTHRIKSSL